MLDAGIRIHTTPRQLTSHSLHFKFILFIHIYVIMPVISMCLKPPTIRPLHYMWNRSAFLPVRAFMRVLRIPHRSHLTNKVILEQLVKTIFTEWVSHEPRNKFGQLCDHRFILSGSAATAAAAAAALCGEQYEYTRTHTRQYIYLFTQREGDRDILRGIN